MNALVPGLVDAALTRHEDRYAEAIETGGNQLSGDEATDGPLAGAKLPLGVPWLEPDAIAPALVFLASDAARMISGTSLAVTGGDSANLTAEPDGALAGVQGRPRTP